MKKGKYLVTGLQGSGKTTAGRELKRQGYVVFDVDHTDGLGKLRELKTDKLFNFAEIALQNSNGIVDWEKYWYEVQADKLKELLDRNDLIFITGRASNIKKYYDLFDKVFVLTVDPETARKRLVNHEHASHHLPSEIDQILDNFEEKQQDMISASQNTVQVDACRSLENIVAEIKKTNHIR